MVAVFVGSVPPACFLVAYFSVGYYLTSDRGYRPDRPWFPLSIAAGMATYIVTLALCIAIATRLT